MNEVFPARMIGVKEIEAHMKCPTDRGEDVILELIPPEFTESVGVKYSPNMIVQALACKSCGVKLKIIGFGTISGPFKVIGQETSDDVGETQSAPPPSAPESQE